MFRSTRFSNREDCFAFCWLTSTARHHPSQGKKTRRFLDICPIIPPLIGNLAGLTHLLAPWSPAVGQNLLKNKKNHNNSNRLNYLSARVTGVEQLPVLTACGRETLNCITQKSNEGWSQLTSSQQLQGRRRARTNHCSTAQSNRVWSCQSRLKESDTRHMAPAGLQGAARLCALVLLAGINSRILSSKSVAGKLSCRGGLGLAICHAPCRS